MGIQKTLVVIICGIFFTACRKGESIPTPKLFTSFGKGSETNINGSVFFIGPELDSVNTEIIAACDCCASDLAFLNDSFFVYVERCMGGDVYVKGTYLIFGNILFLHTANEMVLSEEEMSIDQDVSTTYEVIRQKRTYHAYTISSLKGKQLITYIKDDYTEYGMAAQISVSRFLEEFRREKILREFLKG